MVDERGWHTFLIFITSVFYGNLGGFGDSICLAQRTQRTQSSPTSLHGAPSAVQSPSDSVYTAHGCPYEIPFVSHRGRRGRGDVFSVSVIDTWLSMRDTICLAQRTQRTQSSPTSLHGAPSAVQSPSDSVYTAHGCPYEIPFVSHRGRRGRGDVFSVSVIDTWLSMRDTICLAQRAQRARSPPTSLHVAPNVVGYFRHHLGNQGDSMLRLPEQLAWNDAGVAYTIPITWFE